jgi:hypothetical protein
MNLYLEREKSPNSEVLIVLRETYFRSKPHLPFPHLMSTAGGNLKKIRICGEMKNWTV